MTNIDINGISEALNDKADTNLENTIPQCIDYIVETWKDNYSWYRVYKSGWCEQGGIIIRTTNTSGFDTILLHKPYKDIQYQVTLTFARPDATIPSGTNLYLISDNYTINGFNACAKGGDGGNYLVSYNWEAKGFIK